MGGRGSRSASTTQATPRTTMTPQQQAPQRQAPPQAPTPPTPPTPPAPPQNTITAANLSRMTDAQLANIVQNSMSVDMPNYLNDANDATQRFVVAAGMNAMPTVLDDRDFDNYLRKNNIPRSHVLARSIGGANDTVNGTAVRLTPQMISQMMKYSKLNYVGGKKGGRALGSGTYFDMNGGRNTGYANGTTLVAVLDPKKARVITTSTLRTKARAFESSHPQFARQMARLGGLTNQTYGIYAMAMGYNVISNSGTYRNVLDRDVLVYRKTDA